jgi:hypothetical protein
MGAAGTIGFFIGFSISFFLPKGESFSFVFGLAPSRPLFETLSNATPFSSRALRALARFVLSLFFCDFVIVANTESDTARPLEKLGASAASAASAAPAASGEPGLKLEAADLKDVTDVG